MKQLLFNFQNKVKYIINNFLMFPNPEPTYQIV